MNTSDITLFAVKWPRGHLSDNNINRKKRDPECNPGGTALLTLHLAFQRPARHRVQPRIGSLDP